LPGAGGRGILSRVNLHRERALQAQIGPLDKLADATAAEALGDAT